MSAPSGNIPCRRLIALLCGGLALPAGTIQADEPGVPPTNSLPPGLGGTRFVPATNPSTPGKIKLGRRLFFDPVLSRDRTLSCASCHQPEHGFATAHPRAVGLEKRTGRRNAPTLLNRAFGTVQFWDGRAAGLEEQALLPIDHPDELGATVPVVLDRLRADATYPAEFQATFPDGLTAINLARAIASFERTLLSGNSRIDQFHAARPVELSRAERQGLWLFESRAQCWRCHSGNNFTDEQFHNTGVGWGREPLDLGRAEVTRNPRDRGRFKTPTLRDIARTAPYMHDGSLATLKAVVEFYNRGGQANENLDPVMKPLNLTPDEIDHLVAFLEALTGQPSGATE